MKFDYVTVIVCLYHGFGTNIVVWLLLSYYNDHSTMYVRHAQ